MSVENALKILTNEFEKIMNDDVLLTKYKSDIVYNEKEPEYIDLWITIPKEFTKYAWEVMQDPYPFEEENEYFYIISAYIQLSPDYPGQAPQSTSIEVLISDGDNPIQLPFTMTNKYIDIFLKEVAKDEE